RVPRKAAATLSDWLALQRRVTEKRAEEARRRREQRDAPTPKAVRGKTPAPPPAPAPEQGRLTPLMQWEALNWVDAKTDAGSIAGRVCGEALSAGSWYYGDCTPGVVERFLEVQVKDGLLTW